jgi:hypothetical protein
MAAATVGGFFPVYALKALNYNLLAIKGLTRLRACLRACLRA